ncbi:MAG: G5 domain-containing protein, partial [bacterium]|nr:G5 domain-containing protein [bacterium]
MLSIVQWLSGLTTVAKLGLGIAVIGGSSVVAVPAVRGCTEQPVTFKSVENEVIGAEIAYVKDGSLNLDETREKTPGVDGAKEVTYEVTTKCDRQISKNILDQKETKSAQKALVSLGTRYTEDNEVAIPYKTITEYDSSLEKGTQVVSVDGVNGLSKVTYEIFQNEGEDEVRRKISTQTVKKPVNKVITVGTKV